MRLYIRIQRRAKARVISICICIRAACSLSYGGNVGEIIIFDIDERKFKRERIKLPMDYADSPSIVQIRTWERIRSVFGALQRFKWYTRCIRCILIFNNWFLSRTCLNSFLLSPLFLFYCITFNREIFIICYLILVCDFSQEFR